MYITNLYKDLKSIKRKAYMYNDKFQDVNLFWKTVGNPYLKKMEDFVYCKFLIICEEFI